MARLCVSVGGDVCSASAYTRMRGRLCVRRKLVQTRLRLVSAPMLASAPIGGTEHVGVRAASTYMH